MTSRRIPAGFASLARFVASDPEVDGCDLCAAPIARAHDHLFEPEARKLSCVCPTCAILFSSTGETSRRRVVSRADRLNATLSPADWESLGAPVRLVFLGPSAVHGRLIGLYPSAAGNVEASFPSATWERLVAVYPELSAVEPDVEGVLVDATGDPHVTYRISVDVCFGLMGALRAAARRRDEPFPGVDRWLSTATEGARA